MKKVKTPKTGADIKEKKYRGKKKFRSSIGGQAVLEGVMMRGEKSMATAVRDENGNIVVETRRIKPTKQRNIIFRLPFIRGVVNFFSSMFLGVGILMRSAAVFDAEEEPGKFEKWLADKCKINVMSIVMGFSVILGLALSIGLFFILPQVIVSGISKLVAQPIAPILLNLMDGAVRMLIFVMYIILVSLMKEIRRVFMYHGAEHKTISCYEHGLELTVENAQKMSTLHDRCGSTFMILVMIISILLFSLTGWQGNLGIRLLIRLALLPAVAGLSYELLKFLALFDNWFVTIIKSPGFAVQKLTTKQPDDSMVEVAIAAFKAVQEMDNDETIAETSFDVKCLYKKARKEIDDLLKDSEAATVDWLFCEVLGIKRDALAEVSHIRQSQYDKIKSYAQSIAGGTPLQYVLGNTSFYGYTIKTDSRALIPRAETEELVFEALKCIKANANVLDLCTGSGAIAIALKKERADIFVKASDISADALSLAAENAVLNDVEVAFVQSDLFAAIDEQFDTIVSNPPYIKTADIATLQKQVQKFEPLNALDGGADGLDFYRRIAKELGVKLSDGGNCLLEIGCSQAAEVCEIFEAQHFKTQVIKDMQGLDRIVKVSRN